MAPSWLNSPVPEDKSGTTTPSYTPSWNKSEKERKRLLIQNQADLASFESERLNNLSVLDTAKAIVSPSNVIPAIAKPVIATYEGAKQGWNSTEYKSTLNPLKQQENSNKAVDEATTALTTTLTDAWKRSEKAYKTMTSQASASDKAIDVGMAGLGLVNVVFSPITTLLKVSTAHPFIGPVATTIEKVFGAVGNGSAAYATTVLDNSPLSQDDKDRLRPLVGETASLVGMILAGKAGEASYGKVKANTGKLVEEMKSINVNHVIGAIDRTPGVGTNAPRKLNVTTDPTSYEPYVPDSKLPVIDYRETPAQKYPEKPVNVLTGSEDTPTNLPVPAGMKLVPSWNKNVTSETGTPKPTEPATTSGSQYEDGRFQSRTSLKTAEQSGAVGVDTGEVPYQQRRNTSLAEQNAEALYAKDKQLAVDVVEGKVDVPEGLMWGDVFKVVKRNALKEKDAETLIKLSRTTQQTELAQGLQALDDGYRLDADPEVAAREISRARINEARGRISAEAKKASPMPEVTKESFADFIQSIKC